MTTTLRKLSPALATLVLLAASASAQTSLYHYAFDDAGGNPTVNSGTGSAIAVETGSVVLTAPGSYAGSTSHGLWDSAGNVNPNGDSLLTNIAGDGVVLGNFEVSLDILYVTGTAKYDDWLSFSLSDGGIYRFTTNGDANGLLPGVTFGGPNAIGSPVPLNDGAWHTLSVIGTTIGPDAVLEYFVDGASQGTSTHAGGATLTFMLLEVGNRADGLFNRHMSGGIDEVRLNDQSSQNSGDPSCDGSGGNCPCFTIGAADHGCPNSGTASGAALTASGHAAITNDSFSLSVSGIPGAKAGLCVKGSNQLGGGNGNPVGDGLLCAAPQKRSQVIVSDAGGTLTMSNWRNQPFGTFPGVANAGVPTYYQWWYRDPQNTCSGQGFNFTNGWAVTWMP